MHNLAEVAIDFTSRVHGRLVAWTDNHYLSLTLVYYYNMMIQLGLKTHVIVNVQSYAISKMNNLCKPWIPWQRSHYIYKCQDLSNFQNYCLTNNLKKLITHVTIEINDNYKGKAW